MNEVIYNSDLIIRNASELATLCVFYEKVYVPYTSEDTSRKFAGARFRNVEMPRGVHEFLDKQIIEDVPYWRSVYKSLFDEKLIEMLPAPPWGDNPPIDLLLNLSLSDKIELLTKAETLRWISMSNKPFGPEEAQEDLSNREHWVIKEYLIKQDLALHFLREDLALPQLFINSRGAPSRDFLVGVEAKATFAYLVPAIGYLTADQILEVRRKVKDLREGFAMHLQKLSRGVEDRLKGEDKSSEIERWAKSIVDTEMYPLYREFRRQLLAEKTGFWGKVLGRAFMIDSAPLTPKFYVQLLKELGLTALAAVSERKETLSNENQAYLFMKHVEDIGM